MSIKMPDDFENLTEIEYGYDGGDDDGISVGDICLMSIGAGLAVSLVYSVGASIYDKVKSRGISVSTNASFLSTDEGLKNWVKNS